jgi:hypothetical protein
MAGGWNDGAEGDNPRKGANMSILARTGVIAALIAAMAALVGAVYSSREAYKLEQFKAELARDFETFKRQYEAQRQEEKYKEPLLRAAYELQSRLYNILKQNLIGVYLTNGDQRTAAYVVDHTAFVIGQYFCWVGITRKNLQFIDRERDNETSRLTGALDEIRSLWLTDKCDKPFMVFAGEQNAIGGTLDQGGAECMGYGAFLSAVLPKNDKLVDALRTDVKALPETLKDARPRLVALQHALIDLLAILDPNFTRFKEKERTKV